MAEPLDLLVAPPVVYGYRSRPLSGGGQGFVGTLSVSARTLMALVEDVTHELIRSGFRRIVLLNWHFENANFIYEAAYLAHERAEPTEARIMVVEAAFADSPRRHGRALRRRLSRLGHGARRDPRDLADAAPAAEQRAVRPRGRRRGGPPPVLRRHPDAGDFVPVSGALWKATQATAEKGSLAWAEIVENLATAIRDELPAGDARVLGDQTHRRAVEGLEQVS